MPLAKVIRPLSCCFWGLTQFSMYAQSQEYLLVLVAHTDISKLDSFISPCWSTGLVVSFFISEEMKSILSLLGSLHESLVKKTEHLAVSQFTWALFLSVGVVCHHLWCMSRTINFWFVYVCQLSSSTSPCLLGEKLDLVTQKECGEDRHQSWTKEEKDPKIRRTGQQTQHQFWAPPPPKKILLGKVSGC